jgi:hypothetical protein
MEVKTFKFTNGDEIMGRLVEWSDDITYKVERPRGLLPQKMQDGQIGIAFVPWVISNPDGTVEILKTALAMTPMSPSKEMSDAYLSQTTGLQIVTG